MASTSRRRARNSQLKLSFVKTGSARLSVAVDLSGALDVTNTIAGVRGGQVPRSRFLAVRRGYELWIDIVQEPPDVKPRRVRHDGRSDASAGYTRIML